MTAASVETGVVAAPARRPAARLPLLGRVVAVAALVGATMMVLTALILFQNARTAIALETEAGRRIARDYAIATVGALLRDHTPDEALEMLPSIIVQPRHVRIVVFDNARGLVHIPTPPSSEDDDAAPEWFAALLQPAPAELFVPVRVGQKSYGRIVITPDPADEIGEVWDDFSMLAMFGAAAYLVGLLSLALVVRHALRPLERMAGAFDLLEAGDTGVRIGSVSVPELAALAERFNRLAAALEATLAEKDALNRSLVSVQDAERKAIALELHDELGPCLFGLRVEAKAILDRANQSGDTATAANVASMLDVIETIQTTNRALLDRLRPMEIGQISLGRALDELIARFVEIDGEVEWDVAIARDLPPLDESTEITVYRLVQEATTNALRHAGGNRIRIGVAPSPARDTLMIAVEDDGRGIATDRPAGLGLRGMRERAEAIGGHFEVGAREGGGTRVAARLPVGAP